MFAQIEVLLKNYAGEWEDLLVLGVIMVSAITVLIGILKPVLFNKIKWKPLRRALLAFSNVFLCLLSTVVLYEIEHYDYNTYWHSAVGLSLFSIVWYWVYENTCLRDLIATIGRVTLKKAYGVASKVVDKEDVKAIEKELYEVKQTLKTEVKAAVKNAKVDKELKNL